MPFNPDKLREADEDGNGWENEEPPLGTHEAILVDTSAFTSRNGNDICKLTFIVQGNSPDKGRSWDVIQTLEEDSAGLAITKRQLKALGLDFAQIDGLFALDDELRKFHSRVYEVEVQRNGRYVNTYIQRELTQTTLDLDAPVDTVGLPTGPAPDDDVPF